MDCTKKTMSPWEIKYGQIALTGSDYDITCKIFREYMNNQFDLETFNGYYENKHFLNDSNRRVLRLACKPFFSRLNEAQTIYLKPVDNKKIAVLETDPNEVVYSVKNNSSNKFTVLNDANLTRLLIHYCDENVKLREENNELKRYKERLERYQNLDYIFEDERFMEDWLERNIHKAIPNLEIIDRQPFVTWNNTTLRNKPDFFCLDKTTRELVIVENKVRGRHHKIETQYLSYRSWAKKNLAFINGKYSNKSLKATENFKFVIITDTTDEKLESICEDNRITLILIDGGVIFEELVPYYLD